MRKDAAPGYDEATMTESLKAVVLRDRNVVAISGPDRVKFLQGLMTNDIRRLAPDRALYAGFLTGQGKLLCDVFVMQDGDRILIDIAAALVEDFVKRLTALKLRAAVEISEAAPAPAVAAVWGAGKGHRRSAEEKSCRCPRRSGCWARRLRDFLTRPKTRRRCPSRFERADRIAKPQRNREILAQSLLRNPSS
jgi:folate-binding Fe-S cluster repair protein YgfZ